MNSVFCVASFVASVFSLVVSVSSACCVLTVRSSVNSELGRATSELGAFHSRISAITASQSTESIALRYEMKSECARRRDLEKVARIVSRIPGAAEVIKEAEKDDPLLFSTIFN